MKRLKDPGSWWQIILVCLVALIATRIGFVSADFGSDRPADDALIPPVATASALVDPIATAVVPIDPIATAVVPIDPIATAVVPIDPIATAVVPIDPIATAVTVIQTEVTEIEAHFHTYDHWFGAAAAPSGETHVADHMTVTAFQSTAGNNTWGAPVQILGSSDTPHVAGNTKFDLSILLIEDVAAGASLDTHLIQIGYGETITAALAADTVSEVMSVPEQNGKAAVVTFRADRQDAGTKVWLRHWVSATNAPTMDFFIGLHEYVE